MAVSRDVVETMVIPAGAKIDLGSRLLEADRYASDLPDPSDDELAAARAAVNACRHEQDRIQGALSAIEVRGRTSDETGYRQAVKLRAALAEAGERERDALLALGKLNKARKAAIVARSVAASEREAERRRQARAARDAAERAEVEALLVRHERNAVQRMLGSLNDLLTR